MTATFSYAPSFTSVKNSVPRLLTATFGDGYQQDAVDGINADLKSWDISFVNIASADADTIEAFLSDNLGLAFLWTPPGGDEALWKCATWKRTPVDYGVDTVAATFKQVLG